MPLSKILLLGGFLPSCELFRDVFYEWLDIYILHERDSSQVLAESDEKFYEFNLLSCVRKMFFSFFTKTIGFENCDDKFYERIVEMLTYIVPVGLRKFFTETGSGDKKLVTAFVDREIIVHYHQKSL